MSLLTLFRLLLISAPASASRQQHPNYSNRHVCSSSPLRLSHCPWRQEGDHAAQVPLGPASGSHHDPWSSPLSECVTAEQSQQSFCIYTFPSFADGRGISILSTPSRIDFVRQLPAFANPAVVADANREPSSPPYEKRAIPGKGVGEVATRTLYRGDRIFAYTPVLLLDHEAVNSMSERQWLDMLRLAVERLPSAARKSFWDLYSPTSSDSGHDRVIVNSFNLNLGNFSGFGVLPETSRINHDCRPNAAYFFDVHTFTHYVHAMTTIVPGTEITITYIDGHSTQQARLAQLSSTWRFGCSCSLCSLHPSLAQTSDSRLVQIRDLERRLRDWETAPSELAEALISLYEQERFYSPLSLAYRLAALTYCAEGDRWKAIQYAQLAIEFGILDAGFEDDEVMMNVAQQPEGNACWSIRSE